MNGQVDGAASRIAISKPNGVYVGYARINNLGDGDTRTTEMLLDVVTVDPPPLNVVEEQGVCP
jgi:hypothetical protein